MDSAQEVWFALIISKGEEQIYVIELTILIKRDLQPGLWEASFFLPHDYNLDIEYDYRTQRLGWKLWTSRYYSASLVDQGGDLLTEGGRRMIEPVLFDMQRNLSLRINTKLKLN